jgi:HAD superfamily hydrolase (TIGR01459 family)
MQHLTGFSDIAGRYDGFIVDLWGVIHDGVTPYAGAVDCLTRLIAARKRVVLLSNAPRRAYIAQQAMREMGIADDLYTGILTSGEATYHQLRDRADPWFAALGSRAFHIGQTHDRNVIEGLPITLVDDPADASFALNTGGDTRHGMFDIAPYEGMLVACRAANLAMVCANPDLEVIREGRRLICAGTLTQRYEALGGTARWIGKPDPAIYAPVLAMLGVSRDRVLAVGDALRTDVAGAAAAGIDACWVLGGIHAVELGSDTALVERTAKAANLAPVASLPSFVW